uniref:UDP-N-acetylglucosamine transporter n=2 Tax=Macrostomum lignano TaxID=282301 RepID=A0A1I8HL35_9PLAT
ISDKQISNKVAYHMPDQLVTMAGNNQLIKVSTLIILTLQNVSLILVMRYIRTRPGDMFFSSTAVVCSEVVKFFVSCGLVAWECGSMKSFSDFLIKNTYGDPIDCLKISVPAVIYVLQNNLLYVAISNLDAVTYQVTYQLKLLTTAFFSVIILRKALSKIQWVSLVALFAGVAIVQLQTVKHYNKVGVEQNPLLGLLAVVVACLMSGFAGVYFEFMLKNTEKSLWWRNVQLAFEGVLFGVATAYINDGSMLMNKGFLYGYDGWVLFVILLQSVGGLVVAVVVKYLDNIIKGFATSAAIIIACIFSIYMFNFQLSPQFVLGTSLVIAAIFAYAKFGVARLSVQTKTVQPTPKPCSSGLSGVGGDAIQTGDSVAVKLSDHSG